MELSMTVSKSELCSRKTAWKIDIKHTETLLKRLKQVSVTF